MSALPCQTSITALTYNSIHSACKKWCYTIQMTNAMSIHRLNYQWQASIHFYWPTVGQYDVFFRVTIKSLSFDLKFKVFCLKLSSPKLLVWTCCNFLEKLYLLAVSGYMVISWPPPSPLALPYRLGANQLVNLVLLLIISIMYSDIITAEKTNRGCVM